jgi:transposase
MDGVVEIITGRERRRQWSTADKLRIVAETHEPGVRVCDVAARHVLCQSLVFAWRRQVREGLLANPGMPVFTPVRMLETPAPQSQSQPAPALAAGPAAGGFDRDRVGRWPPGAGGQRRESACTSARAGGVARMIPVPAGVRVWLANGHTDMRKGMNGLALQVQQALERDPHAGDLYVFRGRRGDLVKILWHDGLGMSLYAKRLERGRFVWPQAKEGVVSLTPAILSMLLEGIDWRNPQRTWRPEMAG